MQLYVDQMDTSRRLMPIGPKTNKKGVTLCKVYWKQGAKKGSRLMYGGTTEVPTHLLVDEPLGRSDDRIAYIAAK